MTRGSNDTVQVRAQRRKDGRWSVRIDLVGWNLSSLMALVDGWGRTGWQSPIVAGAMRAAIADVRDNDELA